MVGFQMQYGMRTFSEFLFILNISFEDFSDTLTQWNVILTDKSLFNISV